jgi:signal transduction histidine kinase
MSATPITLDPETLDRRIRTEQLALMCRLSTIPLIGSIGVGAIIAYAALEDSGPLVCGLWYGASLAIMLLRWRLAHAFLQRPRAFEEVQRWQRLLLTLVAVFAVIWSIPPAFLLPSSSEKEIILTVMFIGATATGIGSLAPVRHAYTILLIPFTLPYAITQWLMGGDRWLISLAFLMYVPVMTTVARRQTDSVERQIRLALENELLAEALRREHDRVQQANCELQLQVEQHRLSAERVRRLNRDLEAQAAELRTANNDLEGFSYSVSHDLRAPLRAIDGFSYLLQESRSSLPPGEPDRYLGRIRENIRRMSALIDDLLAFSACSRQPVDMGELPMEALVSAAVNEVQGAHADHRAEIRVEPLPRARGDQRLMRQVWINLLDNAVKYSSKVNAPLIIVRGREEADRFVYEVIDNGVGFDNRHASKLFGVFQRMHGADEYPGTGVGLAIVQRIVSRHGGEVWASGEIDHGATFGFTLPKSTVTRLPVNNRNAAGA